MVEQYLANDNVKRKNGRQGVFAASQRVFISRQQTPMDTGQPSPLQQEAVKSYDELREKFDELCVLYRNNKEDERRASEAQKW